MSLTDSNDNLSIGPLSVLTTVPWGAGAFARMPLGPLVAGRSPTRIGSLSIDRARPWVIVLHPATTSTVVAQAIAVLRMARFFMTNLIPTGVHDSIVRDLILDPEPSGRRKNASPSKPHNPNWVYRLTMCRTRR